MKNTLPQCLILVWSDSDLMDQTEKKALELGLVYMPANREVVSSPILVYPETKGSSECLDEFIDYIGGLETRTVTWVRAEYGSGYSVARLLHRVGIAAKNYRDGEVSFERIFDDV